MKQIKLFCDWCGNEILSPMMDHRDDRELCDLCWSTETLSVRGFFGLLKSGAYDIKLADCKKLNEPK